MIRNLFAAALFAALAAGLLTAAIQHFRVTPLILHAETFEGEGGHSHAEGTAEHSHDDAAATTEAEPEEWAPQDGFERTAYTTLATVLAAAGFALVIGAVSMFANIPITFANGLLWGAAGFIAFSLAPAYGLAPELPGMPAAEVFPRQLWWAGTALATGGALLLLAKTRASWAIALAVALIVIPHIIGAPVAPDEPSAVPAHLATEFAAVTLGTSAVFWALLGAIFGRLNDLFAARSATTPLGATA
ncbi:cobalt transporter subunit CbtA [Devosia yakushimensis]|uniref:Cobalt transporter subunit CbtA n=1 Tax=Devosia yakushimensis TaxID=470028 RepID=A0ABQ5UGS4_9HYPH|nr:CbtA family protein [Devosia yakushimensis]GLQ10843.1 cobalt transporter subunit CbtA [Devosia yakushimensis]